ncbi:SDR family NAD(P)-dependent oxidoreductase [Pseudomonas sp. IC_126]|uniref:SDR family oxidoreductase n=1 Tax=Pseudomonas sp. IC_126 TaxID=2547400 RepID=UPI00103C3359|nr:SDR family NAD(P)-dependent oxidoreductase [Pseudomonas sp. IC_126]TCD19079.1 SDR family NAD(P)-dependent oxidoreductase [Pseudomonas sp. IC_126]
MHILITGAANGIGAAVTAMAAGKGYRIIATDLDMDALQRRWQALPNIRCQALDVRDAQGWTDLVAGLEHVGIEIDVLINAAGVLRSGQTGELKQADIDLTMDVNVKGVIFGVNAVAAGMKRRRRGHIINIGSIASLYATPGTTTYAASKFAVRGFSIAAAGDLRPFGVAVTLFGPGPVKTAMLEQQRGDADAALTFSGARALSADEVAAAILGPVLRKRPLEYFLPAREGLLGKLCNAFPGFFLSQVDKARARGLRNFTADAYRPRDEDCQ